MKGVGLRISTISLVNGLIKSIDNGVSKSDYAYNSRNLLTSETQTLASRPARVVAYDYDDDSLRKDLTYPSAQAIEYAWTARAQLQSVSAGVPPPLATYSYDKAGRNTALVHENGITESKTYDAASQLLANTHLKGSTAVSGHGYTLDTTGRRTAETFADGTTPSRSYGYDTADQVTAATYGSSQSDTYAYDAMGNRTTAAFSRSVGVPPTSGTVNYGTANSVNQYISVTGLTPISHDANGNLLQQNGVTYRWDSENRLLAVTPAAPALGDKSLVHAYDGQHRRVTSTVREWTNFGWQGLSTTQFIYDGWNVIEEYALNPLNSVLLRSRTWGNDLSGSMQGAGGVGGLLLTEEISGSTTTAYHFAYDGNGNVTEITDLSGNSAASYRYDAFGNTLVATGTYASSNKYRFSTKPLDSEVTNALLYYYGYRYYDPVTGRWPSRDPIGERGGFNLYGFLVNNDINDVDILGGGGLFGLDWETSTLVPEITSKVATNEWKLTNQDLLINKTIESNGEKCCWRIYYSYWELLQKEKTYKTNLLIAKSSHRDFEMWATRAGGGAAVIGLVSANPIVAGIGTAASILGWVSTEYSNFRESSGLTRIVTQLDYETWVSRSAFTFEKGRVFQHSGECNTLTDKAYDDVYSIYRLGFKTRMFNYDANSPAPNYPSNKDLPFPSKK